MIAWDDETTRPVPYRRAECDKDVPLPVAFGGTNLARSQEGRANVEDVLTCTSIILRDSVCTAKASVRARPSRVREAAQPSWASAAHVKCSPIDFVSL